MLEQLRRELRPIYKQIANLVSRAVVSRVDDSTKLQMLQVGLLAEETRDGLERFQQYGLTSVPDAGAEAVVLFVGGRRDVGYVVAVDDRRYRLTGLDAGEVALYSKAGASVVLKADGSVEVNPAPGAVVKLAGESDAGLRGDAYVSAEAVFLDALTAYATAIKAVADPTNVATPVLATAITAFKASAAAAKSAKVKLS